MEAVSDQQTLPFARNSRTSQVAALTMRGSPADEGRARVLAVLKSQGPMTDEQIADVTGMNPSSVRPRRGELLKAGLIGREAFNRKTRSGRKAAVWGAR
jgi:predicted ArsR family transcriptional regulator